MTAVKPHRICGRPDVRVLSERPTAIVDTIIIFGGSLSGLRLREIADELQQRTVQFAEVCHLGVPVVFLKIDVGGIVGAPWWEKTLVPESLQVGGHTGSARRRDEQVASELEVKFLKIGIDLCGIGVETELHVGRKSRDRGVSCAEIKRHTVKQTLVVSLMVSLERSKSLGCGGIDTAACKSLVVAPLGSGIAVEAIEARDIGEDQSQRTGTLDFKLTRFGSLDCATVGDSFHDGAETGTAVGIVEMLLCEACVYGI